MSNASAIYSKHLNFNARSPRMALRVLENAVTDYFLCGCVEKMKVRVGRSIDDRTAECGRASGGSRLGQVTGCCFACLLLDDLIA